MKFPRPPRPTPNFSPEIFTAVSPLVVCLCLNIIHPLLTLHEMGEVAMVTDGEKGCKLIG